MNQTPLRSRVLQLTLIPIALTIIILAVALNIFFAQELNHQIRDRGYTVTVQVARIIAPLLSRDIPDSYINQNIGYTLPTALEDSATRAIRVYKSDGSVIKHSGPKFLLEINSEILQQSNQSPLLLTTSASSIFVQAVRGQNDSTVHGWVVAEITHVPFQIKRYQMLLVTAVISFAAMLVGVWLNATAIRRVSKPLQDIEEAIQKLSKNNFDINLQFDTRWAYQSLGKQVNIAAKNLKKAQQELIQQSDQATEELRESLDTVEIQNVKLNMARKEAIEANQAKSAFLANTSHEIRTPINGILGFISLMQKTTLTNQQKEYLNTIQKSSQGLLALLNDVLDVSKLETGQLVLDYTPFNLRDVTEGTLQALAPQAQEKNCELIAIIDPKLPVHLLGDSLRLKQVLINLVNNAIKFSDHCPIIVAVEPESANDSYAKIKFSIVDQGIGISPNQQEHLFNAFSQADASDSRREGGVGLGLTVAKALVEKMQGSISLSSEAGKGSTFWFTGQFGLDRNAPARGKENAVKGKRVLVCESDPDRKRQLSAYLTSMEVHFQFADDRRALVELKNKPKALAYSCAIWDTNDQHDIPAWLEEQNISELCDPDAPIPLIALAPFGSSLEQGLYNSHVYFRVLQKPLSYDLLYDAINQSSSVPQEQRIEAEKTTSQSSEQALISQESIRILAVDDNAANLQLLGELLKDLNTDVTLAENGEQALTLFQQVTFDLVFMDIQMPGIDGLEATQRIRQIETDKRTPVVALTAHAMGDQKAKLLLAGMDDYLSKPVTEQQLRHVIQRWTNTKLQSQKTRPDKTTTNFTNATGRSISQVVDLKLSLELANNKPSLARDMLNMLLTNLPDELAKITDAYQNEDFDMLATIIHKLNGGASYCGVPRLKASCVKLEGLLEQKQYDGMHHPFTMLLDAIHQLLKWHEEFDVDALFEEEQPA